MAKRLKPLERYLRNCLWCSLPFVQKDPEQTCCCKKHQDNVRLGKTKPDSFFDETVRQDLKDRGFPGLIPAVLKMIEPVENPPPPEQPWEDFEDFCDRREIAHNVGTQASDPPELSGLELLAWRNEQRKNNPDNE